MDDIWTLLCAEKETTEKGEVEKTSKGQLTEKSPIEVPGDRCGNFKTYPQILIIPPFKR